MSLRKPSTRTASSAVRTTQTSLQAAIDEATYRGTLFVRGICVGTAEIDHPLAITGVAEKGFAKPTLDAGGEGPVLDITTSSPVSLTTSVTISSLTIQGATSVADLRGGGIRVIGNPFATSTARLILREHTVVRGNSASLGGGIFVSGPKASLSLNDSNRHGQQRDLRWRHLQPGRCHDPDRQHRQQQHRSKPRWRDRQRPRRGTHWYFDGRDPALDRNEQSHRQRCRIRRRDLQPRRQIQRPDQPAFRGRVTLDEESTIRDNKATFGGGVYNANEFTVLSLGATNRISDNLALTSGGGIYNATGAVNSDCVAGVNVLDNTPDDIYTA